MSKYCCIISLFYIKPQLFAVEKLLEVSCIISLFYIKPQQDAGVGLELAVVLYLSSTSNHNCCC